MFFIYNLIVLIAIILFFPFIFFHKNLKKGIRERFAFYQKEIKKKFKNKKIVWLHASSVGEVNVANVLIKRLRKNLNDYCFIITTMTVTGKEQAIRSKLYDYVTFVPFDFIFFVYRFLKIFNPKIVVVIETEFWPNLFYCVNKMKIPLIVANCRISLKSFEHYYKFKFFFTHVLNLASLYICQNNETAERLNNIGVNKEKILISGNMKFDVEFEKFNEEEIKKEFFIDKNKFILCAGSTHAPEEEIISDLVEKLENSLIIIAPRHLERLNEIKEIFEKKNISYRLLSEKKLKNEKILLIDKYGVLIKAYAISDVCFIGGSIAIIGGHNPLEAIYFKKPIISGRNIFNFYDIYMELENLKGVIFVKDGNEFYEKVKLLKENPNLRKKIGENAYKIFEKNKGTCDFTIKQIVKFLN